MLLLIKSMRSEKASWPCIVNGDSGFENKRQQKKTLKEILALFLFSKGKQIGDDTCYSGAKTMVQHSEVYRELYIYVIYGSEYAFHRESMNFLTKNCY